MYVLIRNENGKFVAREGSKHSYTRSIRQAKTFRTKEEANGNRCRNETAVDIEHYIKR